MFILMIVMSLNTIYSSQIFDGYQYIDGFRTSFQMDYLDETFFVLEYIMVFIGVITAVSVSNKGNQALILYAISSKKQKFYFILTRITSSLWLVTWIYVSQLMMIYGYTLALTPYTLDLKVLFTQSLNLWFQIFQYMMISFNLMLIASSLLMGIVPMIIFWTLEITSHSLSKNLQTISNSVLMNISGFRPMKINLLIYFMVYIFLLINYIIVLLNKDC